MSTNAGYLGVARAVYSNYFNSNYAVVIPFYYLFECVSILSTVLASVDTCDMSEYEIVSMPVDVL
jgi:hypothetical protein